LPVEPIADLLLHVQKRGAQFFVGCDLEARAILREQIARLTLLSTDRRLGEEVGFPKLATDFSR
jgi:hypothetical protein